MSQTSLLVPVDFSPRSAAALRYAAQLAATSGTGLLVLHVLHESAHQAGSYRRFAGDQMSLPLSQVAQTMLDEFILRVCDNTGSPCLPRPQIETLVVDGLPANRILEVADRYEVAQIIRSRMSRFFHDGVAGQIGKLSTRPVTLIHEVWPEPEEHAAAELEPLLAKADEIHP